MCGRYSINTPAEAVRTLFRMQGSLPNFPPRYNMAPTQQAPIIRAGEAGPECVMARWGLVPSWAKDLKIGNQCINAKAETVTTKPAFRSAFKSRRCLVPVSGFYEWQKQGKAKQPYWIGMIDKEPFAFAGLWERWRSGT
jgi:putative SOS response-associated peptidase YedK